MNDFMFDRSQLPTAPKANLQPDIDLAALPTKPPFTAYVSNISFEADEDKLRAFFKDAKVIYKKRNIFSYFLQLCSNRFDYQFHFAYYT
jgi:hypothetical protein